MKKLTIHVLTLQALVLAGITLAKADTTPAPTHAKELEANFDAASEPLTVQDLVGDYLGRCYTTTSDTPEGMILSTSQQTEGADQGPLFPSTSAYKLAVIASTSNDDGTLTTDPSSANDTITQSALDAFWSNPTANLDGTSRATQFADLQIDQNTALSVSTVSYTSDDNKSITIHGYARVRKGADGYFYVRQGADSNASGTVVSSNPSNDEYCYFWQKLTPQ
jgi:hypothetical protein